ncbi:hypothetical protein NL108_009548 [Boleophthalmus pectinirostris]|nr:hypothetical protein NL108_009548 [Boleophthalmus pectinirostris]
MEWLIATLFECGDMQEKQEIQNSQPVEKAEVKPIQPDYNSKEEFVQYSQEITLDPDTAYKDLALSEGNTKVKNMGQSQHYQDNPSRFNFFWQVLSAESFTGRSYFELKWSGPWIYIAMAYPSIERYGDTILCGFGGNKESWALFCRQNSYNFWHDGKSSQVMGPVESRIGVYLDYEAGVLTFYSVQDEKMTALHRVQTTFARPLHVGLWMAVDATAVFCKLK